MRWVFGLSLPLGTNPLSEYTGIGPHKMDRKDDLFQCKLAEQACRYEEMVEAIGRIACISEVVLSIEEQLLLSTSYKRIVGKRCTWRYARRDILQRVARQALPPHSTLPPHPRITRAQSLTYVLYL